MTSLNQMIGRITRVKNMKANLEGATLFYEFARIVIGHKFTVPCFHPNETLEMQMRLGENYIVITNYLTVICASETQLSVCDQASMGRAISPRFGYWLAMRFASQMYPRMIMRLLVGNIIPSHHYAPKLLAENFSHELIEMTQMAKRKMYGDELVRLTRDRYPLAGYGATIAARTLLMLATLDRWFIDMAVWRYDEECIVSYHLSDTVKVYITTYQVIATCGEDLDKNLFPSPISSHDYYSLEEGLDNNFHALPTELVDQCDIAAITDFIVGMIDF